MAQYPPTLKPRAPWGFFVFVLLLHGFDALLRYGTSPLANYWVWVLMAFWHVIVVIMASRLPEFQSLKPQTLVLYGLIGYVWGPLWSLAPAWLPVLKYFAALMMWIAPFWILVLFIGTQEFPKLSLAYMVVWVAIITWAFFPQVMEYAGEQGYAGVSPAAAAGYAVEKISEAARNAFQATFVRAPRAIGEQIQRAIAEASGVDYYASRVDEASRRKLGVLLENLRPAEKQFVSDRPAIVYATMKAETLDAPLFVRINCFAEKEAQAGIAIPGTAAQTIPASRILPRQEYGVRQFEQQDIDCVFDPNTLAPGSYAARMQALFDFGTSGYSSIFLTSAETWRDLSDAERQDARKAMGEPRTVSFSGPVQVRQAIGQQPVTLVQGERLPTWHVSIENRWEQGRILGVTNLFLFTPKGIELREIDGQPMESKAWAKAGCADLPNEAERAACDDAVVNVHSLSPTELSQPKYRDQTTIQIRASAEVTDSTAALGPGQLSPQNFKVAVYYNYQLERDTNFRVVVPEA